MLSKKKRLNVAPLVSVVDDDISVRKSLDRLIRSARLEVNVFASAEEFLNVGPSVARRTVSYWTCACRG